MSGSTYTENTTLTGIDGVLGIGLHFRGGPIHIIPKISLSIGKFTGGSTQGTPVGDVAFDGTGENFHVMAIFGIQAAYDIALGATPPAAGAATVTAQ